jgi:hypothetical protein
MAVMARESWTDERLDDLSVKVDRGFEREATEVRALRVEARTEFTALRAEMTVGFARVDREMKARFERVDHEMKVGFARVDHEMKAGFDKVDERFDAFQRILIIAVITLCGGMFAGFGGLIAAQLWG